MPTLERRHLISKQVVEMAEARCSCCGGNSMVESAILLNVEYPSPA
jgi:hypothetical protein